jgi:hypothetical protein
VCTREHRCVHEQARSSISTPAYNSFTDAQPPPPHRPRPPHTALPERSAGRLHRLLLEEATRVVALPVRVREEVVTPRAIRARLQHYRASRHERRAAQRAARQSRELGEAGAARHAGRRERAPPERPAPRASRRGARLADPRERVDRLRTRWHAVSPLPPFPYLSPYRSPYCMGHVDLMRSHAVSHNSRTVAPLAERRGRARSGLRAGREGGRPASGGRTCRPVADAAPSGERCSPVPRRVPPALSDAALPSSAASASAASNRSSAHGVKSRVQFCPRRAPRSAMHRACGQRRGRGRVRRAHAPRIDARRSAPGGRARRPWRRRASQRRAATPVRAHARRTVRPPRARGARGRGRVSARQRRAGSQTSACGAAAAGLPAQARSAPDRGRPASASRARVGRARGAGQRP